MKRTGKKQEIRIKSLSFITALKSLYKLKLIIVETKNARNDYNVLCA